MKEENNAPEMVSEPQEQNPALNAETIPPTEEKAADVQEATAPIEDDAFSIDAILRENRTSRHEDWMDEEASAAESSDPPAESKPAVSSSARDKGKKSRRKGCLFSVVWVAVIFAVAITLAVGIAVGLMDYLGMGKEMIYGNTMVQINIEMGTSMSEIGHILKENDIILSETLFKVYTKLSGEADFQYGYHDFRPSMGYKQIVESLQKPAKSEDLEVKIKESSTVDEIFELLEEKGVCLAEDLYKAMEEETFDSPLLDQAPESDAIHYRLEGYLYPDTYQFYKNDSPKRVLQKMINNLENKFTPEMRAAMEEQGKTVSEIMTMASIIELESCGYYDEMPNISAVFYNRLNYWPAGSRKLQSDPTINYPYGDGAYNTYEIEGLPPGPVCNPTQAAIQAALSPTEDFEYYFFVTDKNNSFYYSKTNGEHEKTIANLKRRNLWRS